MANSKHAHYRYNILDYCFKNLALSKKQLLSFLNQKLEDNYDGEQIQLRQLDSDLAIFRRKKEGFEAPLPPNIRIYRYTNPNFSIAQRPLLEYEQYLVDATSRLLERFENHPKYNKLAEALIKFQDEEEQENDAKKILFYDHNEEYKGIKHLKPLYLAIKKKQALQIIYKGFKDKESSIFEFHPHILKQYNRRWFVYGLNKTRDVVEWSIPLDERIITFEVLEDVEYIESHTDWETFFRTMVGVVRPIEAQVEKVVLRFHNGRENYFKTKPFQPDFEEFFEEEKQDQVWFETIINKELVQQLLSYGQDLEVLEPERLKEQMREQSNTMQQFYTS
ncbi:helix-turn-helix transcriptional regulator [Leeuwenhoekiella marinoflava]|uniref:Predicted DNA-binding transcriptional regulator YafY, contains an HTH and WYL domains n=2 Tax=Leeuwenhoekiella marinoflava TaxID=988 RepID=A0ABY1HRB3_9FLAO|nr:WYL domain-containing protein [Leeuwenhoekiella marinoflava]RXG30663.1 putative DNA-binding transcriptional regulator YafY [Leeuwenhoekiella marinoflava]SHF20358.1 Predicted DNA-binding transcriptional regulator YafY, contains an HTH and WYL domains [Leeuwenhoekiella marinoflava DSM 3653]